MLLKALYGDVQLYGQQEDALVAADNAAHALETAEEQEHRRALREAQQAAVAACRPNIYRRPSDCLCAGSNSSVVQARQPSAGGSTANEGTCGASKRPRELSCGPPNGAVSLGLGESNPTDSSGAKRRHSLPLLQPRAAAAAAEAEALSPPHGSLMQQPLEVAAAAARAAGGGRRRQSCHGSLSPPPAQPFSALQRQPHAHQQQHHSAPSPRRSGSDAASALGTRTTVPTTISGQARGVRTGDAAEGDDVGRGRVTPPPRGPLAVPTARSAAELSFRHPGMVVVQLQPAHSGNGGGGSGAGSPGGGPSGGRPHRMVFPALEKPFMMCPVKWTVAHVAQLLSQWLPPRGYGPAAAPVPPDSIRLEPAPGLLRGSHRWLRGCTGLGALASEIQQADDGRGRGGGGRCDQSPHLVLLYSLVPT